MTREPSIAERPMMVKSPVAWLAGLGLGLLIHVDWHLARPGENHGFDLAYHWLIAIPTFASIAWLARRRWPRASLAAGAAIIVLGVLLGQGVEPLGEVVLFQAGAEPFVDPVRWRVFAEFMAAGVVTWLLAAALHARRPAAGS
jgi:hypothetical protein